MRGSCLFDARCREYALAERKLKLKPAAFTRRIASARSVFVSSVCAVVWTHGVFKDLNASYSSSALHQQQHCWNLIASCVASYEA